MLYVLCFNFYSNAFLQLKPSYNDQHFISILCVFYIVDCSSHLPSQCVFIYLFIYSIILSLSSWKRLRIEISWENHYWQKGNLRVWIPFVIFQWAIELDDYIKFIQAMQAHAVSFFIIRKRQQKKVWETFAIGLVVKNDFLPFYTHTLYKENPSCKMLMSYEIA